MEVLASAGSGVVVGSKSTEDGTLVVMEQSVIDYLQDCSMNTEDDLNELSEEDRKDTCKLVATMFLMAFTKIRSLQTERDSANVQSPHLRPPILPFHVVALKPREFFGIIKQQKTRLFDTWGEQDLITLEDQFRSFINHVPSSIASQAEVERYSTCIGNGSGLFEKSWSTSPKPLSSTCASFRRAG